MREGLLHGVEAAALGPEALHGDYVRPLARVERGEAGVHGAMRHLAHRAVVIAEHDGTRAASTLATPELGAVQP